LQLDFLGVDESYVLKTFGDKWEIFGGRLVWGRASSPSRERHWLILLGGIVRVVFDLRTWWAPNVGSQVQRPQPSNTKKEQRCIDRNTKV
jgi:hypothetical protein